MNEWIAPSIAGVLLLVGTVFSVILNARTARANSAEDRAPDVMQAWREADQARAHARLWEELYYSMKGAFKGYARRMAETFDEDSTSLITRERDELTRPVPTSMPPIKEL